MSAPSYTAFGSGSTNSNFQTSAFLQVNTRQGRNTGASLPYRSPSQSSRSSAHSTSTTDSLSSMGTSDSQGSHGSQRSQRGIVDWFKKKTAKGSAPTSSSTAQAAASYTDSPPAYDSVVGAPNTNQPGAFASSSSSSHIAPSSGSGSRNPFSNPLRRTTQRDDSDRYAFLSKFDTVFVIDDSSSMLGHRWQEAKAAIRQIATVCAEYDDDGIDIYFLNHKSGAKAPAGSGKCDGGYYGISTSTAVESLFNSVRPCGATYTDEALRRIMNAYMKEYMKVKPDQEESIRPVNIIVITDGEPTDSPEATIKVWANKLDKVNARPSQVGIQFFQCGNDPEATRALKELDDELSPQNNIRDIVDTVTWDNQRNKSLSSDTILKTVLGAVHRRLDRQQQR